MNINIEKKIITLFEIKNSSGNIAHSFSRKRLKHLSNWIDAKQYRYDFVKEIWNHSKFYPYISQNDAERLCEIENIFIIRLSNSRPGVISMSHPENKDSVKSTYISYVNKKKQLKYKNKMLKFNEFIDELNKNCIICFEPMKNTDTLTHKCGNTFHSKCIKKWMEYNISCPLCKRSLLYNLCNHNIESNLCKVNNYLPFEIKHSANT